MKKNNNNNNMQNENSITQKTLSVAFCGAPNVGKSTLLNRLLGYKLAVCSPKPQTTRFNIKGIITEKNAQIVIVDTPGIFKPKVSQLEKQIVKEAWRGLCGVDLICLILDAQIGFNYSVEAILKKIKVNKIPIVCVINKSDTINQDDKVILADKLWKTGMFTDIFSLSAKTGKGCEELLNYFFQKAHNGAWMFNENDITDKNSEFIASEFVREQLFLILQKELPYMSACETEIFEESENDIFVSVVVKIGKQNHKKIILGKNGNNLKRIIRDASINLEKLLCKKIQLKIFIKKNDKKR